MHDFAAYDCSNDRDHPPDFVSLAKERIKTDTQHTAHMEVRAHKQHVQDEAQKASQYDGPPPSNVYPCRDYNGDQENRRKGCTCK